MISAATGAMALLMVTLVKDHGLQYLFATTILTGIVQIIFGIQTELIYEVCSEISYEWILNALGILVLQHNCHSLKCNLANVRACRIRTCNYIFISTYYDGCTVHTYCNYHRDKYCTYEWITIKTVGDMGSLPKELPFFSIPDVPLHLRH